MKHEMNEEHSERIPDFFLEQYRLGEADDEMAARIEADPDALRRLEEIDADTALHFERYPSGWFVEQVRRKAAAGRTADETGRTLSIGKQGTTGNVLTTVGGFFRSHPVAVPGLAAAILVLALLPYQMLLRNDQTPDETAAIARGERIKGLDTSLFVFRSAPDGSVEELEGGARVAEGDHLQIAYTAAGKSHGVIFSVDGTGVVTLHYPDFPDGSGELEQGGSVALPYAYVLDDAPRFEEFFFLSATAPIATGQILTEVESSPDPSSVSAILDAWVARQDARGEDRAYQRLSLLKNGDSR